ncbi:hypothetical protein PPERSA_02649 [Pseudocohnilembus persalinus]|uniref:Sperm-tail PG-rich repeat n=1 Tax=Pseudocohnilembus persalinus TaxID=266149 RepID=A0A0V0R5K1_PSEPJ|nr:hypothetical protein PPERSA_02649 [Pseudocohnilembus persalinus]|eukprot:KRX09777.1 hypothetical protein PPERSA_02649 [Pseudocohnilembus persalinus]
MSLIVSTPQQIHSSPLNQSKSKQLYSFPKSERFKYVGKSVCNQFCYDLPPVIDKRKAGIGYGNKYDFTKSHSTTPAPNNYTQKSSFDPKKGVTIGVGREKMTGSGILGQLNQGSPGPGQYPIGDTKSKIKFSFRNRVKAGDPFNVGTVSKNPGPGQYVTPSALSQSGTYFNSKFKSSGAMHWNPPRSKRFPKNQADDVPGPGQYPLKISINENGSYFISNFKSSKCRTFSHEMRKTLGGTFSQTPGPGNYRLPSEFGYYEAKKK